MGARVRTLSHIRVVRAKKKILYCPSFLYFAIDKSPADERVLILKGEGNGVVNNFCVSSDVCANDSPVGSTLKSASLVGHCELPENSLE